MSRIATLYLTRNGLLEPLGQSQVIPYLRGLSKDYAITLITYEKAEDWQDQAAVARALRDCEAHGIIWLPQRFRPKPKVIAPALSMLRMIWLVRREVKRRGVRLVHARSYIPAAAALAVHKLTGVPFIFDMRALWPEELITAKRLRRGSLLHRAIERTEAACLRGAAGIVSLTDAAVDHLRKTHPDALQDKEITVIPTCADLARFTLAEKQPVPAVHSCIGTLLSGWFRIDWLRAWVETVSAADQAARFEVLTRDDQAIVRKKLDPSGQLGDRLSIQAREPSAMPEALKSHTASVMFYAGGAVSELGRSPTRMAEVLSTGLPVIANAGVGDVAKIITVYRVGVLVEDKTPDAMAAAYRAYLHLQQDPGLPERCRTAAEEVFSLEAGTSNYRDIYEQATMQNIAFK